MKRVLAVLSLLAVCASIAGDAAPEITFLHAYVDDGLVHLFVPEQIDWAAHAPPESTIDFDALPRLKNYNGESTTVEYDLPKTPDIDGYFYYLVSADGVTPLRPSKLRGTVTFNWGYDEPWTAEYVHHQGSLVTRPMSRLQSATGGIVMASPDPLRISVADTDLQLYDVLHAERGCEHSVAEHADENLERVDLVAKAQITVGDDRLEFVFVAWSPQHVCMSDEPRSYSSLVDAADPAHSVEISLSLRP